MGRFQDALDARQPLTAQANAVAAAPPPGRFQTALNSMPPEPAQPAPEAGHDFNFMNMIGNVPESGGQLVDDYVGMVTSPVDTLKSLGGLAVGTAQKLWPGEQEQEKYPDAVMDHMKGRYGSWDDFKRTAEEDPVGVLGDASMALTGPAGLAKGAAKMGGKAGAVANTIGKAGAALDPLNIALNTGKAAVKGLVPESIPRKMYNSALNPSTVGGIDATQKKLQTGLDEGLPVSYKGAAKADALVNSLNTEIDRLIDLSTSSGGSVPKDALLKYIGDLKAEMGGVKVEGGQDLAKINKVLENLDDHLWSQGKDTLTTRDLQEFKKNAYKKVNWRARSNKSKPAKDETNKALARAAREEIERMVPESRDLNRREGDIMALQDDLERAAIRTGSHNITNLNSLSKVMTGTALGGAEGGMIGALLSPLDNANVKSRLAIRGNKWNKQSYPELYGDNSIAGAFLRQAGLENEQAD